MLCSIAIKAVQKSAGIPHIRPGRWPFNAHPLGLGVQWGLESWSGMEQTFSPWLVGIIKMSRD